MSLSNNICEPQKIQYLDASLDGYRVHTIYALYYAILYEPPLRSSKLSGLAPDIKG